MSLNKTNPYQSRVIEIRSTELFNGMVSDELYLPKLKPDVGNLAGQPERSIEPRIPPEYHQNTQAYTPTYSTQSLAEIYI